MTHSNTFYDYFKPNYYNLINNLVDSIFSVLFLCIYECVYFSHLIIEHFYYFKPSLSLKCFLFCFYLLTVLFDDYRITSSICCVDTLIHQQVLKLVNRNISTLTSPGKLLVWVKCCTMKLLSMKMVSSGPLLVILISLR